MRLTESILRGGCRRASYGLAFAWVTCSHSGLGKVVIDRYKSFWALPPRGNVNRCFITVLTSLFNVLESAQCQRSSCLFHMLSVLLVLLLHVPDEELTTGSLVVERQGLSRLQARRSIKPATLCAFALQGCRVPSQWQCLVDFLSLNYRSSIVACVEGI
jgi:hypothetical protein